MDWNRHFPHLRLHIAAYGTSHIKPKHHLNHALPKQFHAKGVHDAFVCERLHLRGQKIADNVLKLHRFEQPVLARTMCSQIRMLADGELKSGLRGKIVNSSGGEMLVANNMQCASLRVTVSDIVYYVNYAGVVEACVANSEGRLLDIVRVLQYRSATTDNRDRWEQTQCLETWPAESLHFPHAWYFTDDCIVVIR